MDDDLTVPLPFVFF